jgi:tetratricopeptide (TPR) repeat protein
VNKGKNSFQNGLLSLKWGVLNFNLFLMLIFLLLLPCCLLATVAKTGVELGEELFQAHLILGKLHEEKNEGEQAVIEYLKAIEANPGRAESYYYLADYYRLKGQNHLCTYYAMRGKELSVPKEGAPFISKAAHDYLLDEELSITAFYTPFSAKGYEAVNRLLVNKEVPGEVRFTALNNALFYAKALSAVLLPVDVVLPKINESENFNPMNPSIQRTDTGYDIICRTVNFAQREGKDYWSRDPCNKRILTRNFLIKTDKEFKRLSQEEIVDQADYPRFFWPYVGGLEDCRLFRFQGANWFTCSVYDANPKNIIQIALGKIEEGGACMQLTPLQGPIEGKYEKNWLPFELNGEIHLIYTHDPFILLKPDAATGKCEKVLETTSLFDCTNFRGSAGPIPFDEGYLTLVHEVAYPGRRYYLHRFVYLDNQFNITKLSPPFYIKTRGIEYCSGMTVDHAGKNLVITLGVEDKEAYIALTPMDEVRNSLMSAF